MFDDIIIPFNNCIILVFFQVGNFLVMSLIPIVVLTILNFLIYKGIHKYDDVGNDDDDDVGDDDGDDDDVGDG